jgi:anhydro-N-acetylmuramic acid kinase
MDHPLLRVLARDPKLVLGLMSGTSADGLDCALVEVAGSGLSTQVRGVRARTYPYSEEERARLHALFAPDLPCREASSANFWLGEVFAARALRFLADVGVSPAEVDLIGSHGQTIYHLPPSALRTAPGAPTAAAPGSFARVPSTLQIGEPAVIAARTGILTVGDFRVADLALSGEGAPLVPFCDYLLYRQPGRLRALQNIGGIANVTLVGERLADLIAFDNGPGNMMIDVLAERASGGALAYDRDGVLSAMGRVQEDVLSELLRDPYLAAPPPKSTGRERYGRGFTEALLLRYPERRPVDLLATAVELTARAIAGSLAGRRVDEVLLSGGGAHNRTLRGRIEALLAPVPVRLFAEGGADADCKEAVAFAVLAVQAVHGQPGSVPQVTGAAAPAVLGKLCLPPPGGAWIPPSL